MQKDDDTKKEPIDMTSDELLDYAIAPEVAERLKAFVKPEEMPEDPEPDD